MEGMKIWMLLKFWLSCLIYWRNFGNFKQYKLLEIFWGIFLSLMIASWRVQNIQWPRFWWRWMCVAVFMRLLNCLSVSMCTLMYWLPTFPLPLNQLSCVWTYSGRLSKIFPPKGVALWYGGFEENILWTLCAKYGASFSDGWRKYLGWILDKESM